MADISKINGQTIKDKTARDNHDALVKEVNETIEAINEALAELEYTLPVATSSALGGIKIGYTASGANLPVALSSQKAYVALTKSAVTSALGYTPASTDYYWANVKISSTSSNTTSPRFQSMRARNMVYGVARGSTTGTPTATILHTGIKWVSGSYMPVLHFTGYAYGLQSPVEFKVGFYIYSDKIGYCGATNMGAWKPEIRLFRETRNNVDYVAVALVGKCYFLGLSVGLQEEMANVSSNIDLSSDKWSFEFLTTYTTDDIPNGNTPPHATCCTVPYKQILNNLGNINFKLAGTTQATYTGADTSIDFNIPNATTSASGLMTAAMVTKLNGIAEGADNVSVTQTLTSGIEIGSVKVGNTTTKLYAPTATEVDLAGYATEKYVQNYVTEFEHALSDGYIDLSAYKFISTERLKGLDTYSEDTFDINAGFNGVYWKNTVAYLDKYNDIITQGTYYGLAPIVAGDNVTFIVDSTNQGVKINANLSNYATTTYVDNAVSALVDSSPETLNTLNELAAALGDDPNFATTVSTEIGKKQNTIKGAATTITNSNLTASRALVSDANGKVAVSAVTSTELGYLDGVTSAIQTQLNGKLSTTGKAASATVADSANAVAWSKVSGKPTFATVATSGSYNDLSNKPTIPAAVSVTQKLTSGTEIGSVTIGSTTTKLYAPTATSGDLSGYLPLSGGTIKGNILFSNSNAQGSQPNLKWKTINSKTPYVGYCTASTDGTFLVASLGGTSYITGLSIGGNSGNLLWKGKRVATTSDIPSLLNYSTLANTIKSLSISGKTITYTKGDNTTGTLTTQDTVYTLPVATSSAIGGIKIGYTERGANIPLRLASEKGYVLLTKSAVISAIGNGTATSLYNGLPTAGSNFTVTNISSYRYLIIGIIDNNNNYIVNMLPTNYVKTLNSSSKKICVADDTSYATFWYVSNTSFRLNTIYSYVAKVVVLGVN